MKTKVNEKELSTFRCSKYWINNSSVIQLEIGINAPLIRSTAVSSLEHCSLCGALNSITQSIVERIRDTRGSLLIYKPLLASCLTTEERGWKNTPTLSNTLSSSVREWHMERICAQPSQDYWMSRQWLYSSCGADGYV